MASSGNEGLQAIVFGASGITGYPLLGQLLSYPTPTTFARIIGLTNRPLHREISNLPENGRIELYSGLDLLDRNQSLGQIRAIPNIQYTTHVYFAAYTGHGSSYADLRAANELLLTNAVGALELCCPQLRFITLQTGGKAYGVEFRSEEAVRAQYNPPLHESTPRIPDPWAQNVFYYAQVDILRNASLGKNWTFAEIRPDAIVGFVPQNNAMNIAQALALFLSLWKEVELRDGAPVEVPFPGGQDAWTALHTDTSQDVLAKFHIYASLVPERTSERAFNVADGPPTSWEVEWPRICKWFGLRGAGPAQNTFDAQRWMEGHRGVWDEWVRRNGLKEGVLDATSWEFMQGVIKIPFRRDYDLTAAREIGFIEQRPHYQGYIRCFEEMRQAKIIP